MGKTTVKYYIDIDETGAVRGAGRVENALEGVENQSHKTGTASIALGNIMADMAQQVGAELAQLPGKLFEWATSAEETAAKYQTVLGPSINKVNGFLDEFANKAGLSTQEGQDLTSTTAAMAQGMGFARQQSAKYSIEALKLAGDISSFNNAAGGTKEVLAGINAAVTGEREQLKKYGIVIRETDVQQQALANTGKQAAAALTDQEKATATLQLITQRAGKAVGDLDRTQNSTQNTMRRLNGEVKDLRDGLSKRLLPAFHALIGVGLDLIHSDFFKSMIAGMGTAADAVVVLVTNFDQLAPVLLAAAGAYAGYVAITNASVIATKAAAIAQRAWNLAMEANPIGLLIGLLGGLVGVLYSNSEAWQGFKTLMSGVWAFMKELFFNLPEVAWNSFQLLGEVMRTPFATLRNFAGNMFEDLAANFWSLLSAIKKGITGDFAGAWDELRSIGKSVGDNFLDAASEQMAQIGGRVDALVASADFGPAIGKMAEGGAALGSALADMFTLTAKAGVQDGAGDAAAAAGQALSNYGVDPNGNLVQGGGKGPPQSAGLKKDDQQTKKGIDTVSASTAPQDALIAKEQQLQDMMVQRGMTSKELAAFATADTEKEIAARERVAGAIGKNIAATIQYANTVKEAIRGVIMGVINQVIALWVRNAVQTAGATGPLALAITPVLVAGAQKAAKAIMGPLLNFEQGGLLSGPLHRNGGIPAQVGHRGAVELEGDEYVINRESTRRGLPVINAMNADPAFAEQLSNSFVGRSGALTINAMPAGSPVNGGGDRDMAGEVARGIRSGLEQATLVAPVQIHRFDEDLQDNRTIERQIGND